MKLLLTIVLGASLLLGSVDINNASKSELRSLDGIGAKKAEAIMSYRKTHCFKSIKSITDVKGVGSKIFEKNKSILTAGKCKK